VVGCVIGLSSCGGAKTSAGRPPSARSAFADVCVGLLKELQATVQHDYFGAPVRFARAELERTALESAKSVGASRDRIARLPLPQVASRVRALDRGRREFDALARQVRRGTTPRLMTADNLSRYKMGQRAVLRACVPPL
jgi:hypothetical protein